MLDVLRKGQRWMTAIFVVGIGGAMVFFIGLGGPLRGGSSRTVVQVGPHQFDIRAFERTRAQRESVYQNALGDEYDARAMRDTLDDAAARTLVDRAILALEAEALGLTVSRKEIERSVLAGGGFRDESGRFDRQAYENWAEYEYGNERNFMSDQHMVLLARKMMRLLDGYSRVSRPEARAALVRKLAEIRIAFVLLELGEAEETSEIDEARVREFLEDRESEARALYSEHSDRYDTPERVQARHILLKVEPDADAEREQEVRAAAEALLEEIRGGADFSAVAERESQDPGSRQRGGDLGEFERGRMVPAFEEVAFELEPGQVSEPVRSEFGFHIIRVEEHRRAELRPFESVREDLAREVLAADATHAARSALANVLVDGIRGGRSLEEAARAEHLTLERSGWIRRRPDGYVPGLGASQDLLATAFTLAEGESSERIFEVGKKLVLVQLFESKAADSQTIEAQIDAEQERLLTEKRDAQIGAWVEDRRSKLVASGELNVNLEAIRGPR
ncbi:MAG: peptidylprolyl isomerase [Myxococcota bacterium]